MAALSEEANNGVIYEVIIEQPYTNCCERGEFDKDVYRFTDESHAIAFMTAMKAIHDPRHVSKHVEDIYG